MAADNPLAEALRDCIHMLRHVQPHLALPPVRQVVEDTARHAEAALAGRRDRVIDVDVKDGVL